MAPTEPTALDRRDGQLEFFQVFNRLAVALRATDIDGATKAIYFDALRGFEPVYVTLAAQQLAIEPGRRFFPSTAEWHAAAESCRRAALRRETRTEPWRDECQDCGDSGWLHDLRCSGKGECGLGSCQRMARRGDGYGPHTYATPCSCRATNRTYQRTVEAGMSARRAGKQTEKGA